MPAKELLIHAAKLTALRLLETAPDAVGSVSSVRTSEPQFVLTYDDGPAPGRTHDVLRALGEHGATATFFVLVPRVRAHRRVLDEVIAAGHEIGLHGCDHRHLPTVPTAQFEADLQIGRAELEDATGRPIRWFRPPYGDQTPRIWRAIRRAGMESVLWSSTSWDWNPDVDNDTRLRMAGMGLRSGCIVLLHDGYAGRAELADDGPEPLVDRYDLTHRLLVEAAARNLVGRSLGDALSHGTVVTRPHFTVRPSLVRSSA